MFIVKGFFLIFFILILIQKIKHFGPSNVSKKSIEVSFVTPRMEFLKVEELMFLPFVCLASWPCWKPGAAHYHGLVSGLQKISVSMYNISVVVFF